MTKLSYNPSQLLTPSFRNFKNVPAAFDLDLDGFDAGFFLVETEGCLDFSLLGTFAFFFVLLVFFTVNSSSSLSSGSLKSTSLSESVKELLLFTDTKRITQRKVTQKQDDGVTT